MVRRTGWGRAAGRILMVGATAAFAWSCAWAPSNVLEERLVGGGPIKDLVAPDRPTVILIYPPDVCFACLAEMATWQRLERQGSVHLALVLDRKPSESDQRALAMRRIKVSGILARPHWLPGPPVPREYLIENDSIRAAGTGLSEAGARSPALSYALRHLEKRR